MSYCVEPAVHVPQADAAVRQVGRHGDADGDVDGNVAAERGRDVVSTHAFRARAGQDVPGRNGADEYCVQRDPSGQGGQEKGGGGVGRTDRSGEEAEVYDRQDDCVREQQREGSAVGEENRM